jgi:hypothetical protein
MHTSSPHSKVDHEGKGDTHKRNCFTNQTMVLVFSAMGLLLSTQGVALFAEQHWQLSKIDECASAARYNNSSIALDSGGNAQIVYQRGPNSALMYARFDSGVWKTTNIESGCSVIRTHFALDAAGIPHILYSSFNCKVEGLKYAGTEKAVWETVAIYSKPTPSEDEMMRRFGCNRYSLNLMVSDSNNLFLDNNGVVHVVYVDPEAERLVHGYRSPETRRWEWESLEEVGNHRLTVSRINPVGSGDPTGQIQIAYKKYTESKLPSGAKSVKIELRLATKRGQEWNYQTVTDHVGYIDCQSQIIPREANGPFIAFTRGAGRTFGDLSMKWVILQADGNKWAQRYEGEPREQLLAAACIGNQLHLVVTRAQPDKPEHGSTPQDTLMRLTAGVDWKWESEKLLALKQRHAVGAVLNKAGDLHVLLASTSATFSKLESGVLRSAR